MQILLAFMAMIVVGVVAAPVAPQEDTVSNYLPHGQSPIMLEKTNKLLLVDQSVGDQVLPMNDNG
jgi:hypothetical protein